MKPSPTPRPALKPPATPFGPPRHGLGYRSLADWNRHSGIGQDPDDQQLMQQQEEEQP